MKVAYAKRTLSEKLGNAKAASSMNSIMFGTRIFMVKPYLASL